MNEDNQERNYHDIVQNRPLFNMVRALLRGILYAVRIREKLRSLIVKLRSSHKVSAETSRGALWTTGNSWIRSIVR